METLKFIGIALGLTLIVVGIGGGIAAALLLDGMRKRIKRLEDAGALRGQTRAAWNR